MWAILLSFIFTPVFGGIVCGLNWRAMGKEELSVRSFSFMRSTLFIMVLYIFAEPMLRNLNISLGKDFVAITHTIRFTRHHGWTVARLDIYRRH